jgi:hypothetical protein
MDPLTLELENERKFTIMKKEKNNTKKVNPN